MSLSRRLLASDDLSKSPKRDKFVCNNNALAPEYILVSVSALTALPTRNHIHSPVTYLSSNICQFINYDFAMAKNSIKPVLSREGSPEPTASPQRPGTSGTELLLTTNRRTASANYIAAQRAEQVYKAKKRAAGAQQHRAEARQHFKKSTFHLKEGFKSLWNIAAAVPWMIRGWREDMQQKREQKTRKRDLEKRKKLEEKLARQSGLGKETEKVPEPETE